MGAQGDTLGEPEFETAARFGGKADLEGTGTVADALRSDGYAEDIHLAARSKKPSLDVDEWDEAMAPPG